MSEPNLDSIGGSATIQQEISPEQNKENFCDKVWLRCFLLYNTVISELQLPHSMHPVGKVFMGIGVFVILGGVLLMVIGGGNIEDAGEKFNELEEYKLEQVTSCLLYTSPSPRD